ncbi:MAG: hypothetical protein A2745_00365 [Candidatus Harrisonbacteria bacterium RIFCSPHIGHO2_01_FULL_44_13]|uniref:Response regulatory domain-containing protein n=1 Tax=Candidatus Harrisonbacteria bacterium RIFCSPLOWO2_01_FULL_44_18 TaxID=1798407 RepID=A0A1G1ZLL3_9BACT|nr:MAG: hypothetical protein A2745_00365 [Candidatus Harrisonbacteria bacterium RIFCSPHIGHO2_01_FULL_44_13]OGY65431.1 MAG: hypothetical protein A3A16_03200 [Candidatus Harrisonbacteria bacterium RIFCSPLOWO2_01_FULL_44_18]
MKKPNNQPRILIVEDEAITRKALVYKFRLFKVVVDESVNGEEALEKMKKQSYALILLDLRLPIKDGYQVLQEMKADLKLKNIPVWALSNLGQKEEIERAMALGCNEYFVKVNLNIDELVKKVLTSIGLC